MNLEKCVDIEARETDLFGDSIQRDYAEKFPKMTVASILKAAGYSSEAVFEEEDCEYTLKEWKADYRVWKATHGRSLKPFLRDALLLKKEAEQIHECNYVVTFDCSLRVAIPLLTRAGDIRHFVSVLLRAWNSGALTAVQAGVCIDTVLRASHGTLDSLLTVPPEDLPQFIVGGPDAMEFWRTVEADPRIGGFFCSVYYRRWWRMGDVFEWQGADEDWAAVKRGEILE